MREGLEPLHYSTLPPAIYHVYLHAGDADRLHAIIPRIIEEARPEFDVEKRNVLYHRFDRILHDEQPYTFLFTSDNLIAMDKRFRNTRVYPIGAMDINSFWVPAAEQKYKE